MKGRTLPVETDGAPVTCIMMKGRTLPVEIDGAPVTCIMAGRDGTIDWANNRNWQIKVLDTCKVSQTVRPRHEKVQFNRAENAFLIA